MPIVLRPPGPRPPLPSQLAALGLARRRAALAAGGFALAGTVLAALLLACALDAGFHLPPLARGFALVLTLAAAGVVWLRDIAPALRHPTDPLAVALELETRYPRLNDSLASAVDFLHDPDGGDGRGVSTRLQAAAVRRAERLVERHDFAALVPTGRCWRLFWLCLAVACAAAPLALSKPARTRTALARFADPFGSHPWPTKTRVELLAPEQLPARVPKGDAFELRFAVRGVLPDRAEVAFRVIGGEEFEEHYPLAAADPKNPGGLPPTVFTQGPVAVVGARLDPGRLSHDFQFRVRANDADTGWLPVAVVPPPRLVPLDGRASPQIYAVPPAYTGLRPLDLPDGAAVVEVPVGTVLTLRAAADVPLSSAVLTYHGDRSAVGQASAVAPVGPFNPVAGLAAQLLAESIGADIPLTISGDRKTFFATFRPSMSGMYALRLTDETGLSGTRLLELRLNADPAPAVALLSPAPGRGPVLMVPTAAVGVQLTADDKVYALRRTFIEYRVGREGTLRTVPLADAIAAVVGPASRLHPPHFEAACPVPVTAFLRDDGTPVREGDVIFLRAAADDWDDVTVLKEPGRSGEVEIRVASPATVEAVLQKGLAEMRPDLQRAREQQREAVRKTEAAKPQADGTLTPADREALQSAEQTQRQIRGKLGDPTDGLRNRAEQLRDLARANGLPRSETTDRAERVADELSNLTDRLDAIEPLLGDARQQSTQPVPPGKDQPVPRLLTQAGRQQRAIDDGLSDLIDLLGRWGGAGEIRGSARMLGDAVRRETTAADRMPERVPAGKPPEALPSDQRAELEREAGRLDRLADQSGALLDRAAKLAAEKDREAEDARRLAGEKDKEADELRKKAAALPPNTPEQRNAAAGAEGAKAAADEARAAGKKAEAEADALRRAANDAGGQALPDDLRRAAEAMRANRQSDSAEAARSAAARLDRLAGALADPPADDVPELRRKQREQAANQLDALAGAQDELRKKTEEAARTADPERRAEELKRLAAEQEKLLDQTRELVQRLTRERADDAAKDARDALRKMEQARDDLERGMDPATAQKDATDKLDAARDKLDSSVAQAPQELADERRRKLADQITALLERQKAAAAEAARIQEEVVKGKKWTRPLVVSYADLEDRERGLGVEVRALADRDFADLPVFARVVKDAAGAIDKAADKVKLRVEDTDPAAAFDPELEQAADARVRRPMDLAARRLQQILDALKPDSQTAKKDKKEGGAGGGGGGGQPMPQAQPGGGGNRDLIPPLAQLKALRALQAELNERTAEFAKLHPDPAALTDDDREELKELEDAQKEIAVLFEQVAEMFRQQGLPPDAKPQDTPAEEKP